MEPLAFRPRRVLVPYAELHHVHKSNNHEPSKPESAQGHDMMMTMQMWFQATTHVTLWFKSWHITSPTWYSPLQPWPVLCLYSVPTA